MRLNQKQTEIFLAFAVFCGGIVISLGGVFSLLRLPQIQLPGDLNVITWWLLFVLVGLCPATAVLCQDTLSRLMVGSIGIAGLASLVIAPITGAVGLDVYLENALWIWLPAVLLFSMPVVRYHNNAKRFLLLSVIGVLVLIYSIVLYYIILAGLQTRSFTVGIPLLGATIILLSVLRIAVNEL